jgi:hypothetical protein
MFDKELLLNFRKVYNKEHPNESPIKESDDIWSSLKQKLHSKCKSGRTECIVAHLLTRPRAPNSWITKPYDWLSSIDIENVEKQYMKLFPKYKFLGCIPIDFDLKSESGQCLVNVLCSLKLKDLYSDGFSKFGIVFNTDKHDGPGQHWFALFCDISPELEYGRITYFDSYATTPEPEIKVLMSRWKQEIDSLNMFKKPMELSRNITKHQFKDSECGMYSLYFHYCCLLEIPMDERIPDDVMNKFRKLLFRVG